MLHYQADVFQLLFGDEKPALLDRANALIHQWRSMGRPVIFANFALGHRYEMANADNQLVSGLTTTGLFREPKPVDGLDIHPHDKLYNCPRISVFHGTGLDADLRAQGIDTLVMAGVTSTGVLFSSVGYASDADYKIHLIRKCCFDPDHSAEDALFRTSFSTRSRVIG